MDSTTRDKPWEDLRSVLDSEDVEQLTGYLEALSPAETALGYFVKALLARPGTDQLLWHTLSLEALLLLDNERGEVTKRLTKRICAILAETEDLRKTITKRFRKIYEVRSSLAHGRALVQADIEALMDAGWLSRYSIIKFLGYLGEIIQRTIDEGKSEVPPIQKEILALLDLDSASRERLSWLMKGGFQNFAINDR